MESAEAVVGHPEPGHDLPIPGVREAQTFVQPAGRRIVPTGRDEHRTAVSILHHRTHQGRSQPTPVCAGATTSRSMSTMPWLSVHPTAATGSAPSNAASQCRAGAAQRVHVLVQARDPIVADQLGLHRIAGPLEFEQGRGQAEIGSRVDAADVGPGSGGHAGQLPSTSSRTRSSQLRA